MGDFQLDVSVPRNPKLAAVFYRLRLIEAYGTGIRRMFEAYEGSGKTPVFDITRSFFRVRLPNRNYEGSDELGGESRLDVVAASAGMGAAGGAGSAGKELLNQERVVLAMLEEQLPEAAKFSLLRQAIAEQEGMTVTEEDIQEQLGDSYDSYVETYGLNYIKQDMLIGMVDQLLLDEN